MSIDDPTVQRDLCAALKWAERQLRFLVTEDDGDGAFIRGGGIELAGFGAGVQRVRAAIAQAEKATLPDSCDGSVRLIALRAQIGAAMETIHGIAGDGSQAIVTETERQLLGAWADLSLVQALINEWLSEMDDV